MADLKSETPSDTLDVIGKVCPYPLVLAKKKLETMESGSLLKILSDSPSSAQDSMPRFCERMGFQFEVVKIEDKGIWEIFVKKS
ncbi:MAG: sulfurtransferase TusA family protein [Dissulfurispiraceae bacterium]|nr:sulfurtransferase TusA family protein [Dissulfurispiraceae bacterium]